VAYVSTKDVITSLFCVTKCIRMSHVAHVIVSCHVSTGGVCRHDVILGVRMIDSCHGVGQGGCGVCVDTYSHDVSLLSLGFLMTESCHCAE